MALSSPGLGGRETLARGGRGPRAAPG